MKIMYVIGTLGAGGAEKLVVDVSSELVKRGWNVSIVALGSSYDTEFEKKRISDLKEKGVKVFIIKKRIHKDRIKTIRQLRKIIKAERPNIIHAHLFVGRFYALLATTGLKIPLITTYHSVSGFGKSEKLSLLLFQKRFKFFIAVSNSVKEVLKKKFNLSEEKITVIYNGINIDDFKHRFLSEKNGKIVFLLVGRLVEQKGHELLLNAIYYLKTQGILEENVIFKIAGDGPLKNRLQDKMKEMNLENYFRFLGNVKNIPKLLAEADVYVMPSLYEGFGISLIEAMAAGKPLVLSSIEPFKEVLDLYDLNFSNNFAITKFGVVFEIGNSVALANAIKWMINNENRWKEFGENARQRAKIFDILKTVGEHESLYKEVVNKDK